MTAFLNDTFTGTGALSSHTPDTGSAWGDMVGGQVLTLDGSGRVYHDSGSATGWWYNGTTAPSADYYCEVVARRQDASLVNVGPIVRVQDSSNFYFAILDNGNNKVYLFKRAGGSHSSVAEAAFTFAEDTDYTIRLEVSGTTTTTLVVKIDGATQITYPDSTSPHTSAGFVGMWVYSGAGTPGSTVGVQIDSITADTGGGGTTATETRFISPPTSVAEAQSFALTVRTTDASGTVDTSKTGNVTVTTNLGTLSGTTTVAAVAGVASFSGLALDTQGSATLTAAYTGLTSGTANVTVTENTTDRYRPTLRNAMVAGIEAQFSGGHVYYYTSSTPGSGTQLVDIAIPANCFTDPSSGAIALTGTWQGTASASGTPGSYRVYKADGVTLLQQGTVGYTGSGADVIHDNGAGSAAIASSDIIAVSAWAFLAPAT